MELASWFAVHRNQLMESQNSTPYSRIMADEVEPMGDALMLLVGVLDQRVWCCSEQNRMKAGAELNTS